MSETPDPAEQSLVNGQVFKIINKPPLKAEVNETEQSPKALVRSTSDQEFKIPVAEEGTFVISHGSNHNINKHELLGKYVGAEHTEWKGVHRSKMESEFIGMTEHLNQSPQSNSLPNGKLVASNQKEYGLNNVKDITTKKHENGSPQEKILALGKAKIATRTYDENGERLETTTHNGASHVEKLQQRRENEQDQWVML